MPKVKNGAELVKRLRASGTPDQRLAPARDELMRVHQLHKEVANSEQVIAALERKYGADHMTVVKAKAIAATGEWAPPAPEKPTAAVEELLLGEDAPKTVSVAAPDPEPAKKQSKKMKAIRTSQTQDVVEVA